MKCRTQIVGLFLLLAPASARSGFTETLPEGAFLLEEAVAMSWVDNIWDNWSNSAPLLEAVERYEPGGGKQGVISAQPSATYTILINSLQYGIFDNLSVGIGIPVILSTEVDAGLSWEPGDYQRQLGRAYSEQDFWDWAESMGQERPGTWVGNQGVLSDIVLGMRFRFTDRIEAFEELGLSSAITFAAMVPTGSPADPEEILSLGTTLWDLHTQGDLAFHLALEKDFEEELDSRLRLGIEGFYEVFFPREREAPSGENHPLLLTYSPYVGETYEVKPGDFSGFSIEVAAVPYKGPSRGSWLTDGSAEEAEGFPPILTFSVRYTFVHLQQSDWRSDFPLWDWEREKCWRPGYKNILGANMTIGLLRLGIPVQAYVAFRTIKLIPGKNCRAAEVLSMGLRIPLRFW